jgi:nicotinate-nucleotide pyrophosphorylase (carboxylating)
MWNPEHLIKAALEEDIGPGDVTSAYFVPKAELCSARIFAKEVGVLAGSSVGARVFALVDPRLKVSECAPDGTGVTPGQAVMVIEGPTRSVLTGERTALNFIQRLSGVASLTRQFTQAIHGTGARILDTRKTTPGWRHLEKDAVRAGGGTNHRIGLYDQVMVKDNHLLAEGDLSALQSAIDRCRTDHPGMKIELEADRIDQVRNFLTLRDVHVILLDNMSLEELRACVQCVRQSGLRIDLEASGGVTLDTVRSIAETGVDFISSGALTHSAKALDFSLELTRITHPAA